MAALGISVVMEVLAGVFLAVLLFMLAKPRATVTTERRTNDVPAGEEPLSCDRRADSESDAQNGCPAAEIFTDDGKAGDGPTDGEPVSAETAAAVADEPPTGSYRLAKSFTARLILSDDAVKERYSDIKNALLSYKKVKARVSRKCETFRCGRITLAKLAIRGKTLCLYLALTAEEIPGGKYKIKHAGKGKSYAATPTAYRITSGLRVRYARQLIGELADKYGLTPVVRNIQNFAPAYRSQDELIACGLIRRVKRNPSDVYIGHHTV